MALNCYVCYVGDKSPGHRLLGVAPRSRLKGQTATHSGLFDASDPATLRRVARLSAAEMRKVEIVPNMENVPTAPVIFDFINGTVEGPSQPLETAPPEPPAPVGAATGKPEDESDGR